MPTEAAFFFAGLLFIAAALGYVFARLGQLDDEELGPSGLDYVRGLRFLLREQPDRALEAFTTPGELDEDTIETHFALGQLFRKRGEVERAIRVHRDLIDRPNLRRDHREQAQFALAEDYLSAGLFDRAETLLAELRGSPRQGIEALRRLIRLAELTHEWERAIELHRELEAVDRTAARSGRVAHYLCELAEQARLARNLPQAIAWLDRAAQARQDSVRLALVRAAVASDAGDHEQAIRCYQRVAEREPSLLVDVLPRLSAACRAAGRDADFSRFIEDLLAQDPRAARAVAFATILDPGINDPRALACLRDFIRADATLQALVDGERLASAPEAERAQALERVRRALRHMASAGRSYRCLECGYASASLQWQCPGCAAWDVVRPRVRLAFESGDR
ncbi:Lipopolysaccharide assembly protein B [Gammaproteobacteria bacterium]|nr:tetratricopeptide repeat protein [Gammaproteobacteria bacterium]QOJ31490.1 MAG: tetratricopeptide repeat protein [Gammaproteobacteria bacterium]CAG0943180.1 Lipopolysaccharide assembly protein B [Gammaproteobacteria bacterium]